MEIIRSGGAFMSVSCQKIDPAQWPRSESFAFFSSLDQPFYSVCFRVDVTALHAYTKANGLSFYHSMVWLVTQAVNETENLRYTLRRGEVYLLPARTPSFTELKKGSEQFRILTVPWDSSLPAFCRAAKEKSERQTAFLESASETDDLVYLSCLPWFDLTCCTNERNFDKDDAIPRITWGKYVRQDDRETLGLSIEVNHRFVDGVHLGRVYEALQQKINDLE